MQRVSEANCSINDTVHSSVKKGFLILVGVEDLDTNEDVEWLCHKIISMRIFSDADNKMNLSSKDIDGDILLVSQFTLFASTKKGNRPSFIKSAKPEIAIPLYNYCVEQLSQLLGKPIKTGKFGADMKISLVNDGPVTILMDSKKRE